MTNQRCGLQSDSTKISGRIYWQNSRRWCPRLAWWPGNWWGITTGKMRAKRTFYFFGRSLWREGEIVAGITTGSSDVVYTPSCSFFPIPRATQPHFYVICQVKTPRLALLFLRLLYKIKIDKERNHGFMWGWHVVEVDNDRSLDTIYEKPPVKLNDWPPAMGKNMCRRL